MDNKDSLIEKLKYLITVNAKLSRFDIINIHVEVYYSSEKDETPTGYDLDIKFDYEGAFEFEMSSFLSDIHQMEKKLRSIVGEYVLNPEGKIVNQSKTNVAMSDAKVFDIDFKVDEKHIFELGYSFVYDL
jgi:hypothetical protein